MRQAGIKVIALVTLGLLAGALEGIAAGPLDALDGRWSGWGVVVSAGGARERVKCVGISAVHSIEQSRGQRVEQSLTCGSASFKLAIVARYRVEGEQITGAWEERSSAATGRLAGTVHDGLMAISIRGDNFSAAMAVTTTTCRQELDIRPQGSDIERISVILSKC